MLADEVRDALSRTAPAKPVGKICQDENPRRHLHGKFGDHRRYAAKQRMFQTIGAVRLYGKKLLRARIVADQRALPVASLERGFLHVEPDGKRLPISSGGQVERALIEILAGTVPIGAERLVVLHRRMIARGHGAVPPARHIDRQEARIEVAPWQAMCLAIAKKGRIVQPGGNRKVRHGGEGKVARRGPAQVDWLPQETILFEESHLERTLAVELAGDATFTAVEAVLLGREAMGEAARAARLTDRWRIHRDGRLVHAEATRLTGADFERDGLSLLAGHNAFATLIAIAPDAQEKLRALRARLDPGLAAAASAMGERLVLRMLAPSGLALRRALAPAIALLSGAGALPRLWTM